MARIRLGDFGGRVAPAVPGVAKARGVPQVDIPGAAFVQDTGHGARQLVDASLSMVAQERNDAARVEAERKRLQAQADHEYQQREQELATAKGVEAYTGYRNDLDLALDGITAKLSSGEVKRADVQGLLDKTIQDLRKSRLEGITDPILQAKVSNHMLGFDGAAQGKLRDAIALDQKRESAAAIGGAIENLQRQAIADPASAIRQAHQILDAQGAGVYGADQVAAKKQTFTEQAWFNHFATRITAARGSASGLKALEDEIAKNTDLDPAKKNALVGDVMSKREVLAAKAERAQASRLRTVERTLNGLSDVMMKGYDIPAEQLAPVLAAAKGTELEGMAAQLAAVNQMTAKFRALPIAGQEAAITELERKVRSAPTKGAVEMLDAFKSIHGNIRTEVNADPISYASRKGLADIKPLQMDPATLGDQLKARLDVAGGMRARYGAPLAVLTKEEAGQVAQFLKDSPVEQKRQLLGVMAGALPDKQAFATLMQQVSPDDPVTAVAGIYASRGAQTSQGRTVSDYILRGQAVLNPPKKQDGQPVGGKVFPMPPDKEMGAAFNSFEKNAFAGKESARNAYFQTARAIYAARSVEEGDFSGEMNSKRWESAMQLATGGIENHNGRAVVLPYGSDLSAFRDGVRMRADAIARSGALSDGVTASDLRSMPLENVGDGRYVFRAGDGVLVGKDGKPLVIDFNQQPALPQVTKKDKQPPTFESNPGGAATGRR